MMKIFKYLYYMMLGVLVGCILMSITGCKEEQKRDSNFVVKTSSSSSELNLLHTLSGTWECQRPYSNDSRNTYTERVIFTENGLCTMYLDEGVYGSHLIYTGEYQYYSGLEKLVINNIVYSEFTIKNNLYYIEEDGSKSVNLTVGCEVKDYRMIWHFSNGDEIFIKAGR